MISSSRINSEHVSGVPLNHSQMSADDTPPGTDLQKKKVRDFLLPERTGKRLQSERFERWNGWELEAD